MVPEDPGETPQPVPYEPTSTEAWIAEVRRTFRYRPYVDGWEYYGLCPRCRHSTSTIVGPAFEMRMLTPDALNRRPDPVLVERLVVQCDCRPGHAKDTSGCGSFGVLTRVQFK